MKSGKKRLREAIPKRSENTELMIRRIDSTHMIKQCAVNQLAVTARFNVLSRIYELLILLSSGSGNHTSLRSKRFPVQL